MASALWSTARVSVSRWGLRTAGRSMSTGSGNEILPTEASSVTSPIVQGRAQDQPSPKALHHVKLSYLHPDSKTAPEITRPGDMSTGRVRPDPVYVPLSRHVFSHPPRRDLLYASVVYYLDSARKGVASTKTRGEVAFSGAKIRPQKGSGQARLGSRNNPLLRKGGVIHGPKPRDMRSKLNRRVRELALRSALSVRWAQGQLVVVKDFTWEAPPHSSNLLHKLLRSKGWHDALFLSAPRHPLPSVTSTLKPNPKPSASDPVYTDEQIAEHETLIRNLGIATNNMVRTEFIRLHQLSKNERFHDEEPATSLKPIELHAYHILKRKNIICDLGAIEWLEEKLGGAIFHDAELHQVARDLEEIDIEGAKGETEDRYMVAEDIMEKADAVVRSTIRGVRSRVRPNDPLDS